MNRVFYIVLFFVIAINTNAQFNLVPNYSFEYHDSSCNTGGIEMTPPWLSPSGAGAVYFNECDTIQHDYSAPQNFVGFQYAKTGTGYAGFCVLVNNSDYNNYRQYIQIKLIDSLINKKKYFTNLYISLADSSNYAIDRVGLYFSNNAIHKSIYDSSPFSDYTPQIENPKGNFILDKINWTLISGIYTAHGGEQYITIGNFYDDANTDSLLLSDGSITQYKESGFYIDDVSVTLINEDTLTPPYFNVYPSLAHDNITLDYNNIEINYTHLVIFDICGRKIKDVPLIEPSSKIGINISNLAQGMYVYALVINNGISYTGKIVVE